MRAAILSLFLVFSASLLPAQVMALLIRDSFAEANEHRQPADWSISHPDYLARNAAEALHVTETVQGEPVTFYRMTRRSGSGAANLGERRLPLPAGTAAIRIQVRMRGREVKKGTQWWNLPGVGATFFFSDGNTRPGAMEKWILLPEGDSDWQVYSTLIPVHENASEVSVSFISQGWTGVAEVESLEAAAVPAAGN